MVRSSEQGPRRPTIVDVARLAGVSPSGASKAFRGGYGVSDAMQRKVREAAETLGYRPSTPARGLRGGRTYTVGVMLSDIRSPYFPQLIEGAESVLAKAGLAIVLAPGGNTAPGHRAAIEHLRELRCDGLLLIGPLLSASELEELTLPATILAKSPKLRTHDSVASDDLRGPALIVDHLTELGHERIGHVSQGGKAGAHLTGRPPTPRARGFERAMAAKGLLGTATIAASTYTEPGGYAGAQVLLNAPTPPTAIFAGADIAALGVLRAVFGARDPIAVCGSDNTDLAALPQIDLTSLDLDGRRQGARAAELLIERLGGVQREALHEEIVPRLVVRTSSFPRSPA